MRERHALIEQEVQQGNALSVRQLCELLQVNRAWYYQQRRLPRSPKDDLLRAAIEAIVVEHAGYGYRRVTHELQRQDCRGNHKRVLRVMRQAHLLASAPKKRVRTTTPAPASARAQDNLLLGLSARGPNQVWVAAITYLSLPKRVAYLAAIVDAYSRVCVGWQLSTHIDSALVLAALEKAVSWRQPCADLIHHSDRGSQYRAEVYVQRLEELHARVSLSRQGHPSDNPLMESFFWTVKREEVYLNDYQTVEEAEQHLVQFLEQYNTTRLHSSLDYLPPLEFEALQALPLA